MRIERISTLGGAAMWVLDQIGHGLMAFPFFLAVYLLTPYGGWKDRAIAAGLSIGALSIREILQWFGKDRSDATGIMLIDPLLDVVVGTFVGWIAFEVLVPHL